MARTGRPGAALALAIVALGPVLTAYAGGAPTGDDLIACKKHVTMVGGGWARIDSPDYSAEQGGTREIVTSAVPAGLEKRIYVSNGSVVKTSQTAGCKWDHIFPQQNRFGIPSDVSRFVVTQLVVPTDQMLWVAAYEETGGFGRPHVAMTRDATFAAGNTTKEPMGYYDDGLPAVGRPVALAVPRRPENGYVLIEEPVDAAGGSVDTTRKLYRLVVNTDLEDVTGSPRFAWEPATLPAELGGDVVGLTMSPRQSSTIWVWGGNTYAWSTDGGTSWKARTVAGRVTTVDIDDTGVAAIFSEAPDGGLLTRVHYDSGTVTATLPTPVAVTQAAHGYQGGVFAIHGDGRTFGYDTIDKTWIDITPPGAPAFEDLHFGNAADGRILIGQTKEHLFRFDLHPNESFVKRALGVGLGRGQRAFGGGVPHFVPNRQVVTVRPGERKDAPMTLKMPPSPGRLDVFFLVDTTSSMNAAIVGLRKGVKRIADEIIEQTNGPACFGVGEVKDFGPTDNPHYGLAAVTPYKLQKKITCDRAELDVGLAALKVGGGDKYPEEAQTIGLTQAVTGAGQASPFVAPGQDAGFVAATRVIVLITDAGFKMEPDPDWEGYPSMDETVQTLMKFGHPTHVVGVLLQTRNDLGPAIRDMNEVARRTNTFAPANGADCDSDGFSDVQPGTPLVCQSPNDPESIAPAIVALLLGVKEPASLGVHPQDKHDVVVGTRDGPGGALSRSKQLVSVVNIRVPNKVKYRPVVTCRPEQDGQDLTVKVIGTRARQFVADAEIIVQCRAKPLPPVKKPPLPEPPPPFEPPPPPRPPLIPALVPPFQPPPVNNPPPNMNVNAGLSQEEQQQFQLAAVTQGAAEGEQQEEEVELAMSALDRDAAAAKALYGCAAGMTLAAAAGMAYRRRTQRRVRGVQVRVSGR